MATATTLCVPAGNIELFYHLFLPSEVSAVRNIEHIIVSYVFGFLSQICSWYDSQCLIICMLIWTYIF